MVGPDADAAVEVLERERQVCVETAALIFDQGVGEVEEQVVVRPAELDVPEQVDGSPVEQDHPRRRGNLDRTLEVLEDAVAQSPIRGAERIGADEHRHSEFRCGRQEPTKLPAPDRWSSPTGVDLDRGVAEAVEVAQVLTLSTETSGLPRGHRGQESRPPAPVEVLGSVGPGQADGTRSHEPELPRCGDVVLVAVIAGVVGMGVAVEEFHCRCSGASRQRSPEVSACSSDPGGSRRMSFPGSVMSRSGA